MDKNITNAARETKERQKINEKTKIKVRLKTADEKKLQD